MFDSIFSFFTLIPTVAVGVAALIASIYFLPQMQPVAKWLGENLPKLLDIFKEGFGNIIKNGVTLFTVLCLCALTFKLGEHKGTTEGWKKNLEQFRKEYRFVPRR